MNRDDRPGSQGMEILVNQPSQSQRPSCQCNNNNGAHSVSSLESGRIKRDQLNQAGRVRFNDTITTHDVTRYADHYDKHPGYMLANAKGWKHCNGDNCKYTGLSAAKLSRRFSKYRTLHTRDRSRRQLIMRQANNAYKQKYGGSIY